MVYYGSNGASAAAVATRLWPAPRLAISAIRAAAGESAGARISPASRTSRSPPSKPYVPRRIRPDSGRTHATTGTRRAAARQAARNAGGAWPAPSITATRPSVPAASAASTSAPSLPSPAATTSTRASSCATGNGGRRAGRADGVEQVRRAVRAAGRRWPDRARDDDRRLAAVQQVAQHRGLLERVGSVGDDDAAAAGGLGGGGARDVERVGGAHLHAGPAAERARAQPGDARERRHGG